MDRAGLRRRYVPRAEAAPSIPVPMLGLGLRLILIIVAVRFLFASDATVASAAVGLASVGMAWAAYWALRGLGRKHLNRPDLGKAIRKVKGRTAQDPDYHI